jgi:hypothetical protein
VAVFAAGVSLDDVDDAESDLLLESVLVESDLLSEADFPPDSDFAALSFVLPDCPASVEDFFA